MFTKKTNSAKKAKRGFTLIELIIVVAILAILAAVLTPMITGQIANARSSAAKADGEAAFMAAQEYQTNALQNSGSALGNTSSAQSYTSSGAWTGAVSTMLGSTYFSNINSHNSFNLDGINVDSNQNITGITFNDTNTTSNTTYP